MIKFILLLCLLSCVKTEGFAIPAGWRRSASRSIVFPVRLSNKEYIEVLKKDNEYLLKDNENLLKDKENLLIVQENLFIVQENLFKDKENMLQDKVELKDRMLTTEAEKIAEISKFKGLVLMRIVVEFMLKEWRPNLSPTDSSKAIVKDHILTADKQLQDHWKELLARVEGVGIDYRSVARELQDIFHELSKQLHNFPGDNMSETGIFIGGPLPHRAAVLLLILALQRNTPASTLKFGLKYSDEKFTPRFRLVNGQCEAL